MEPLTSDDPAEIGGFRLRARLGAGGMGRVYLASTPGGRRVALKVVRPELGDDADFRSRFRQEIEAAQRVRGLYTAELLSADPAATPPWLVTAYVPGPSLQQAVAEHGPMPPETVILLMAGVAEALQAIHAAGVVHRDLKPSNVLLAPDGPRVIDFGIARAAEATNLTQSGVAVGSPQFMAPEQIRGLASTPAVDVFALGAVAAFAVGGRAPFGEGHVAALMHRVLNEPPNLTGCSGPLRTLIERCLAKDAPDRPSPAEIIESCRAQAAGNLGDFTDSWLPPAMAAAAARAPGMPGSARPRPHRRLRRTARRRPREVRRPVRAVRPARHRAPGEPRRRVVPAPRTAPPVHAPPVSMAPRAPCYPAGPVCSAGPGAPAAPTWPGGRTPVPSSLTTAAGLMYVGAGLSALGTIVGLATVHELQVIADQQSVGPGRGRRRGRHPADPRRDRHRPVALAGPGDRTRPAPRPGLGHGHLLPRHRQRDQRRCPRAVDRPDPGVQRHRMGHRPVRRHPALEPALAVLLRRAAAPGHRAATCQPYARRAVPESSAAPGPARPAEHPARLAARPPSRGGWPGRGPSDRSEPRGQHPRSGPDQGLGPGQVNWSRPSQPDRPGQR